MRAKILNPLASVLSLIIGATITMVLEETEDVQWIHTVLVVLSTCLLVDLQPEFEGKILRIVKKIVALILGLGLGIIGGLIVRAMAYNWSSPRWSILLVRLLFISLFLLASILIVQGKIFSSTLFQGKWRIEPFHMSLLCFGSALPLFSASSSLAVSRCVGVLFASAITLIINTIFYVIVNYIELKQGLKGTVGRRVISQHRTLVETVLLLSRSALQGNESDKEKFDKLSSNIRKGLNELDESVAPAPWQRKAKSSSVSRKVVNMIGSHVRTLGYECNSLFWGTMSVASTPFVCTYEDQPVDLPPADLSYMSATSSVLTTDLPQHISTFTNNAIVFSRYFGPSIRKIDSGIRDLSKALLQELSSAIDDESRAEIVDRITSLIIGYQLVEGMQSMEFNFKQVGRHAEIFSSNGKRWNMCAYLVNLGAVIVSIIDLTRTVISSFGLPQDVQDRAIVNLTDYAQKISAIQNLGSMNDLLSLSNPVIAVSSIDQTDSPDQSLVVD